MLQHLDAYDGIKRGIRFGDVGDVADDIKARLIPTIGLQTCPIALTILLSKVLAHIVQVSTKALVL
jgi:hypothetical protein